MLYQSTRGQAAPQRFCDVLLAGLAPDGGLYVPQHCPQLDAAALGTLRQTWQEGGYAALAFEILRRYADDIPEADLRALCAKTWTAAVFGSPLIAPLRALESGLWLQDLSGGPTFAFKDMAMQLLGHLLEYELARRGQTLNILGATSGDTGSAAEYALRGKSGIQVFMLSPLGRMSAFQQAQMYTLQDANIHNIAVDGTFDDCQDIVKSVSADLAFKEKYRIGAVNSINLVRVLAQVIYYFSGWLQASGKDDRAVGFTVPSGNFGNICAGHVARQMGLPIAQLIVATNENDVLDEFFRTGAYRVRSGAQTLATSSPSMDISKASNFERFAFDLLDRDAEATRTLFAEKLVQDGGFDLQREHPQAFARASGHYAFASGKSTHADRLATIRDTWQRFATLIDPHTADGLKVAREHLRPGTPMLVLETAKAIKFPDTIREALGFAPERPAHVQDIERLPRRVQTMAADAARIREYIARCCAPAA